MKKTVWIFSLVVMLLTQVFSPFAYAASGEMSDIEEIQVVEEKIEESLITEQDTKVVQTEVITESEKPENSVGGGDQLSWNNNEPQAISWGILTQIQPESQSWVLQDEMASSWDVKMLSWEQENLKEGNDVLPWSKEWSWFIETIKNFFWMWDSEEKNEDGEFESKEIYWTGEYEWVKVEVYATTWLFESGVYLTINPIIEELDQVKEVLISWDVEIPEEKEEQTVVAFDITFRNPVTKEEVQPKDWTVQVTFNYEKNEQLKQAEEDEEQEVKVYHLNDIDEKWEKIEEITWAKVEEVVVNKSKNEEDNTIVVDAESFSIYAVIKSNLSENITIKYNANWWKFKSWNSEVNELSVAYTKQDWVYKPSINVQAPYRESKDMNAQSWWMFAWWYTTSSNQTIEWLWKVSDTTTNNITVYAKRLPFNDLILNVWGQKIILMDRNMWAEGVANWNYYPDWWQEDDSVLWFYYQWWNNYWFKSTWDVNTYQLWSNSWPDITNYWPGNFYSDSTYYLRASWNYTSWYSRSGNWIINLWWWSNWQWPCPEWYYIPWYWERGDILGYVKNEMTNNQEFCSWIESSWECFSRKLKLPHSWTRDKATANPIQKWYFASYWSSEAYWNNAWYRIFYADTMPSYADSVSNRYASNVRCFRKKMRVTFVNDWEVIQTNYIDKDTSLTDNLKPANPTKEWLIFAWWFNWDEKFSFSKKITEDITLTAKFTDHYYTISFDTDWWSEKSPITIPSHTSMYNTKYSHTPNIDDSGNKNGDYPMSFSLNDVVTIDWAEKIKVKITYGSPYYYYYYATMWEWSHPEYTAQNDYSSSITSRLWWWSYRDDENTKNYEIVWDTVTFWFYGGNYSYYYNQWENYWYYAIIYDVNPNFTFWENPVKEWKVFDWWYKENWEKWNEYNDVLESNITLKAHWKDPEAILLPWKEFNCKLKNLANGWSSSSCYGSTDYLVKNIVRADSIPSWVEKIEIQSDDSSYPIYARKNKWTIYIYSESDIIYMNPSSSYMFYYMQWLNAIDEDIFDTSKVVDMKYMFWYTYWLWELDLSSWNVGNLTSTKYMFYNANSLKKLDLSNWNTTNLEDTSYMFYYSKWLINLNLSGWNITKVTTMYYMFYECNAIETLNLNGWDFSNHPNVQYMFNSMTSLKTLLLRDWVFPETTQWGGGYQWWFYSQFWLSSSYSLKTIDVTNWDLSKTVNLSYLFYDLYSLQEIIWLNTWDTSNIENMYMLFAYCYNLENLDISTWNVSKVTNMYELFYYCKNLEELDLSSWDTSNVTLMSYMFEYCDSLKKLNLDNWNFSKVGNSYSSMFYGTPSLIELGMKNWKFGENITNFACNMGLWCSWGSHNYNKIKGIDVSWWTFSWNSLWWLFYDWESLKSIKWLETWDTSNIVDMGKMFYNVTGLVELDLSSFDTNNVTHMVGMFWNADSLRTVYVSNKFTTVSLLSWDDMFSWATSIVWWNWTVYDINKYNQEYARIDGVWWQSWYFTSVLDRKYEIKYNLNNWVFSWEAIRNYTIRDSFSLPQVIRTWYIFKWWTWSNGNTPEKEVLINWKKWDLTFTANWEKKVEPSWRSWWGGWWSNKSEKETENKVEDQEHNVAEENQEQQEQNIKQETKTPETIKWTTNSSSVDSEVQSAYKWAYKYKVTTMPTLEDAMPDWVVKRWHLAKMVVNYATNILWRKIPEKIPSECRWNDNRKDWESEEIKDYAVKSCALWLMWLDMPKFLPNLDVTRAQFGTIMSRLLWWKKYAWWTPYYRKHLNALKENNIMTKIENPEKRIELRQWVWVMLMRSAENK